MSSPYSILPPRPTRRPIRVPTGCLVSLVALVGSCMLCTRSDAWERFNGAVIWRGSHETTAAGDTAFAWRGSATFTRVAAMAAEDGYNLEMNGAGEYEFVGLVTRARPHPGTFGINQRGPGDAQDPDSRFSASLSTSNNADDYWSADSGRMVLADSAGALHGAYVAYMSRASPRDSTRPRYLVVRGTLRLQRP